MKSDPELLIIHRMDPTDGDGWICYVADGSGGNIGYGATRAAAKKSWRKGQDLGADALKKWAHLL